MLRRSVALALAALVIVPVAASAAASLNALDIIALEISYTTVLARYYKPVAPGALLAGARTGIGAYLATRGLAMPAFPALAGPDRYRAESEIDREVALVVQRYGARIRTGDLVAKTIEGELAALHDPYTVLFRPAAYQKFVGFLDGKTTAGIGAELDVDPQTHEVRIADVFPGSPAETAGLQPGDLVVTIDGAPPPATTPADVAAALAGRPGTAVRIGVSRSGKALGPVAIVRRAIAPPDVTGRIIAGDVGLVRLRAFGPTSDAQLTAALARLRDAHARAYVLDLRANGGGYRDAAVRVASDFVRGTVVTTQERDGAPKVFSADPKRVPLGAPLAVLVDGDTASAAEIVAAAIQDDKAGTLVGTRTFGKGLVQETFALPDGGAIKMTTARYLTPAGRDIDRVGITPDVVVPEPADAHPGTPGADPQLDRALALLQRGTPARD